MINEMVQAEKVEQALIRIVRRLPPERASEVLDFAQFLEFQAAKAAERDQEYTEDDARWDALLATEESQRLLEKLADGALAEIERGTGQADGLCRGRRDRAWVNSQPLPRFWKPYDRLPREIQRRASKAYRIWRENPNTPGRRVLQGARKPN